MPRRLVFTCALMLCAALLLGCSDDKPTAPGNPDLTVLAGGGRAGSRDAYAGGPEVAGPGRPDFGPPGLDFWPLFYADQDCRQEPLQRLITDAAAWQTWWTEAIACRTWPEEPLRGDPDDGAHDPGEPDDPEVAPEVDFLEHVVLVVALEPDDAPGRSVWVQSFEGGVIDFHVFTLGPDCLDWGWPYEMPAEPTSPTIAVLAPRPDTVDIIWQRHDTVFDCSWTPDPHEPITLYYTDTLCDLGPQTAVLRDAETFAAWLEAAVACDEAAWSDWYDLPDWPQPGGEGEPSPGSTSPSPGWDWLTGAVDFTTHAVVILRGDEQSRWGGGVWLTALSAGESGTVIEYAVIRAGADCPRVEHAAAVRPTAAIRVPLPLDEPVTWQRETRTIACDWDDIWPGEPGRP